MGFIIKLCIQLLNPWQLFIFQELYKFPEVTGSVPSVSAQTVQLGRRMDAAGVLRELFFHPFSLLFLLIGPLVQKYEWSTRKTPVKPHKAWLHYIFKVLLSIWMGAAWMNNLRPWGPLAYLFFKYPAFIHCCLTCQVCSANHM